MYISILLAGVMVALAIVYALLAQSILCRIFKFKIVRRNKWAFFFWNSIAFLFKEVLPLPIFVFCIFVLFLLVSYMQLFVVAAIYLVAVILLVALVFRLNKGAWSVKRIFETHFRGNGTFDTWLCIMFLTWLIALPLSQGSVAAFCGGYSHMHQHHLLFGASYALRAGYDYERDSYDSSCLICRAEKPIIDERKKWQRAREEYRRYGDLYSHLEEIDENTIKSIGEDED